MDLLNQSQPLSFYFGRVADTTLSYVHVHRHPKIENYQGTYTGILTKIPRHIDIPTEIPRHIGIPTKHLGTLVYLQRHLYTHVYLQKYLGT